MENIFSSRPGDFLKYGIYTCRFYVNEEWVDLITDTNIPCLRNSLTGTMHILYLDTLFSILLFKELKSMNTLASNRCSKASIWAVNQSRRNVGLLCGEVIRQSDGQL
jgi:hypothetical protein